MIDPASALNKSIPRVFEVAPGVIGMRTLMVNLYFVSEPGRRGGPWLLVDTGVGGAMEDIVNLATELFGPGTRPAGIVLTHGHFDHVGNVKQLAEYWDVPVFAHRLEFPYLRGLSHYPPADPAVGGGVMALISGIYSTAPINLGNRLQMLSEDEPLPVLNEWRVLHTPGHAPGHISLFREQDRVLISGDAVVTTKQESLFHVLTQKRELSGPPAYFTPDWQEARHSVQLLAELQPEAIAPGHGLPMRGPELMNGLMLLADTFWEAAIPQTGRYVHNPAVMDACGVVSVPEAEPLPTSVKAGLAVLGTIAGAPLIFALKDAMASEGASSAAQNVVENVAHAARNAAQGVGTTASDVASNVASVAKDIFDSARRMLPDMEDLTHIGRSKPKSVVEQIFEGVRSMVK